MGLDCFCSAVWVIEKRDCRFEAVHRREKQSLLQATINKIEIQATQRDSTLVSPNALPYILTSYFVSTLTTAVAKGILFSKDDESFEFSYHFR